MSATKPSTSSAPKELKLIYPTDKEVAVLLTPLYTEGRPVILYSSTVADGMATYPLPECYDPERGPVNYRSVNSVGGELCSDYLNVIIDKRITTRAETLELLEHAKSIYVVNPHNHTLDMFPKRLDKLHITTMMAGKAKFVVKSLVTTLPVLHYLFSVGLDLLPIEEVELLDEEVLDDVKPLNEMRELFIGLKKVKVTGSHVVAYIYKFIELTKLENVQLESPLEGSAPVCSSEVVVHSVAELSQFLMDRGVMVSCTSRSVPSNLTCTELEDICEVKSKYTLISVAGRDYEIKIISRNKHSGCKSARSVYSM